MFVRGAVTRKCWLNRKQLIPLIKRLHPDLMAGLVDADKGMKSLNITCMQNLNDLWDTLDTHLDRLNRLSAVDSQHYDITTPFREIYDLSCWLREVGTAVSSNDLASDTLPCAPGSHDVNALKLMKIAVHSPKSLCKRKTIPLRSMNAAVDSIMKQHIPLLRAAGVVEEDAETVAAAPAATGGAVRESASSTAEAMLSRQLHERWMLRTAQMDRRNEYLNAIIGSELTRRRGHDASDSSEASRQSTIIAEVDHYIKCGNITLLGLSPADEIAALTRLRQFLVDFGAVLNFRMDLWHRLIIALYQPNESDQSHQNRYTIRKAAESYCIINVPTNFKRKELLSAFRQHVPFLRSSLLL